MKIRRLNKERIGDILRQSGSVTGEQVEKALDRQQLHPGRLGTHLVELGAVSEDDLAKALSVQFRVPPYLSSIAPPDPAAAALVPRNMARNLHLCPVAWDPERGILVVAAANPGNLAGTDEIRFASGARRVLVQVAPDSVVERLIAKLYDGVEPVANSGPALRQPVSSLPLEGPARSRPRRAPPRGRLLVADPDSKRSRALGSLAEMSGFQVVRVRREEEARSQLAEQTWNAVWLHATWADTLEAPGARVYDALYPLLEQGAGQGDALMADAVALAEEALSCCRPAVADPARRSVSLVRFLAGRRGLDPGTTDRLELRTWRTALRDWEPPDDPLSTEEQSILAAVAAYQGALAQCADRRSAVADLQARDDLEGSVVTALLRWAVGADLLDKMDTPRSLAVLFSPGSVPARWLEHFRQAGWQVDDEWNAAAPPSAVLASPERGLALLEDPAASASPAGLPPVFLFGEDPSGPQTMYALRVGAEDVFGADTHPELAEAKIERAVARWKPRTGQVTGSLSDMGLADMLQILSNGMRTATVNIEAPQGGAQVVLEAGQICHARCGKLTGEEALYALVGWTEGTFEIEPIADVEQPTVRGSTDGLLMEGFRRLDEARRNERDEPPVTSRPITHSD